MQRTSDRGQVLVASSLAVALIAITAVVSFLLIGDGPYPTGPAPTSTPVVAPPASRSVEPPLPADGAVTLPASSSVRASV